MLALSIFLLAVTIRIRRFLERYAIQQLIFRGVLLIGYLFVFIASMHLLEEALEFYGWMELSSIAGLIWHGATIIVILVVSRSFYLYLRTLSEAEQVHQIKDR